jgi:hypothetical protein
LCQGGCISKKTGLSALKLKDGVDDFVTGQGSPTASALTKPTTAKPTERIARLNIDLPESLHKQLKREALDHGVNLRTLVISMLKYGLQTKEL